MLPTQFDYPIYSGAQALKELHRWLSGQAFSRLVVLTDANTQGHCYPLLRDLLPEHELLSIPAGEKHKNLETCTQLWSRMTELALDRRALMINLGGGVIGDLGGFVASTYKRGMPFVQVPTTLLAQVDASVGSKLGIDFRGYKNHIGLYGDPQGVYISPSFLATLPYAELRSGFAEVIKHHLIADRAAWQALRQQTDLQQLDWPAMIDHSVRIKADIVRQDPQEKGLRKALNFGHTIGHALETARLDSPNHLLHGEAVAVGMVAEAFLARERGLINTAELDQIEGYIRHIYDPVLIAEEEHEQIYQLSRNDKKNQGGRILCTMLQGIGAPAVNQVIEREEVSQALRYCSEQWTSV